MTKKNNISVCFTPSQFQMLNYNDVIVVVVDILRATSVISIAFENGIKEIIPVQELKDTIPYKNKENHIIAAERNTKIVEGFNFGNSPYHYIDRDIKNKTLVLTTTNGTKAIHSAGDNITITSSYVNIKATSNFLINHKKDVVILCSGWKNRFNMEDSMFAASLSTLLIKSSFFSSNCDSLRSSQYLLQAANNNLFKFLNNSAYRKRNNSDEIIRDTKFCLSPTINSDIIPFLKDGKLVRYL